MKSAPAGDGEETMRSGLATALVMFGFAAMQGACAQEQEWDKVVAAAKKEAAAAPKMEATTRTV